MPRVKYSYFDSIIWQQAYHKCHCLYKVWCICSISKKGMRRMSRGVSLAGTGIHGYEYYDTRTHPVNMRVSKISIPAGSGYPFLISIFYMLRVLSADTRGYEFFLTSLVTYETLCSVYFCFPILIIINKVLLIRWITMLININK